MSLRPLVALGLVFCCLPAPLGAFEEGGKRSKKTEAEEVEMFDAMKAGQISVRLIPKNSLSARVLIENKTKQPLSVRLPETFAGVHAQVAGAGVNQTGGGGGQSLGGGFGGGIGGGRGVFSVPPEKVAQVKVSCVCLEHGKAEPTPKMKYEIKQLSEVTTKPGIEDLMKALASGRFDQDAIQAAAWHLNNGLSWAELAAKRSGRKDIYGNELSYFNPGDLQLGFQLSTAAVQAAQQAAAGQGDADSWYKRGSLSGQGAGGSQLPQ